MNACTDITGFGLLGHAMEVATASRVDMEIEFSKIPVMGEVYDMLRAQAIAGGLWPNKAYVSPRVSAEDVTDDEINILCDPQTSGGLFITLDALGAGGLLRMLRQAGVRQARVIGKVLAKGKGHIVVKR